MHMTCDDCDDIVIDSDRDIVWSSVRRFPFVGIPDTIDFSISFPAGSRICAKSLAHSQKLGMLGAVLRCLYLRVSFGSCHQCCENTSNGCRHQHDMDMTRLHAVTTLPQRCACIVVKCTKMWWGRMSSSSAEGQRKGHSTCVAAQSRCQVRPVMGLCCINLCIPPAMWRKQRHTSDDQSWFNTFKFKACRREESRTLGVLKNYFPWFHFPSVHLVLGTCFSIFPSLFDKKQRQVKFELNQAIDAIGHWEIQ